MSDKKEIKNSAELSLPHSFNPDYGKSMNKIVKRLLDADYEFMGLLNAETGYLMVFGENKDVDGMARNGSYYDEEMPRVFKKLLLPGYYAEGMRIMARRHVLEELERNEYFICSFPARDFGKTKAGRKQWKFGYLDESREQVLMTRTDITQVYTAERDSLTGLYNQQAFYRHARKVMDENQGEEFVILRFDIDRFSVYNDVYGTEAGDRILAKLGRGIREIKWAEKAVFGRLEADHFCAIYPAAELNASAWSEKHAAWISRLAPEYHLTSSIGIYKIIEPDVELSLMCDRARMALLTVKNSYTQKLAWYDETLRHKLMEEQALVEDMGNALEKEQFILYFQPQINYENNSVSGAEALVRWQHPKRGLLTPDKFIPLFEKNGFILKMDAFVWEKCCQFLYNKRQENAAFHIPIAVNISRNDIYNPKLCDILYDLVQKYEIPVDMLKLEITESAYMENPEQLIRVVEQLRKKGFTVEMDDFGSGYSSLNTLKEVPVDVLKLDMGFLAGCRENEKGHMILYSVIQMAQRLELPVIAEGVETLEQADYLKSLGCIYMQGYYFGRPMAVCEFEDWGK